MVPIDHLSHPSSDMRTLDIKSVMRDLVLRNHWRNDLHSKFGIIDPKDKRRFVVPGQNVQQTICTLSDIPRCLGMDVRPRVVPGQHTWAALQGWWILKWSRGHAHLPRPRPVHEWTWIRYAWTHKPQHVVILNKARISFSHYTYLPSACSFNFRVLSFSSRCPWRSLSPPMSLQWCPCFLLFLSPHIPAPPLSRSPPFTPSYRDFPPDQSPLTF